MYTQDKNSKISVFSFSMYCIKAMQINVYLEKKIKTNYNEYSFIAIS